MTRSITTQGRKPTPRARWRAWVGALAAIAGAAAAVTPGCSTSSASHGDRCPAASTECGDHCVDLTVDTSSCGGCGITCAPDEACTQGVCGCPDGGIRCDGACVNVAVSMASCGACGVPCQAGQVCDHGTCGPPGSEWPMLGGDARHSGFNATEAGKPPLVHAFTVSLTEASLSPPVVTGGRVFVTASGYSDAQMPLWALSVSDGSSLWSYNFGQVSSVGHPSAVGGKVYLQQNDHTPGTNLWVFDATSGAPLITAPFDAQWESHRRCLLAPAFFGERGFRGFWPAATRTLFPSKATAKAKSVRQDPADVNALLMVCPGWRRRARIARGGSRGRDTGRSLCGSFSPRPLSRSLSPSCRALRSGSRAKRSGKR